MKLTREHEAAKAEVDLEIDKTRPKNLVVGVSSGVSNVLAGAVGGVGAMVLGPVVGTAVGYEKGGVAGGTVGLLGGTVAGALGGALLAVGGVVQGTTQLVRGVVSVPNSMIAPSQGKWWNDIEGRWVETNLVKEAEDLPKDDTDILGDIKNVDETSANNSGDVKDPYYYEALGVSTDAEASKIKKQYYILARKYHPDKVDENDEEAKKRFQDISEAYQVLADPDLRKIYDRDGREGLSGDKTGGANMDNQPDPTILYAFLFGSDKFNDYIGTLAMGTSALAEDQMSEKNARKIQIRRCTRIALKLAEKIYPRVMATDDLEVVVWKEEAEELSKASYGYELVVLIGQVLSLTATQFLGSWDSGIGMPSIAKWVKGKKAKLVSSKAETDTKMEAVKTGLKMMKIGKKAEEALASAETEEEKKAVTEALAKEQLSIGLQIMWTITTVDITSTIYEACQMVFFDKSVKDKSVLKKRAKAVQKLGEAFMACPVPEDRDEDLSASKIYTDAAFAAMLETIKRKEEASFGASEKS